MWSAILVALQAKDSIYMLMDAVGKASRFSACRRSGRKDLLRSRLHCPINVIRYHFCVCIVCAAVSTLTLSCWPFSCSRLPSHPPPRCRCLPMFDPRSGWKISLKEEAKVRGDTDETRASDGACRTTRLFACSDVLMRSSQLYPLCYVHMPLLPSLFR